LLGRSTRAMWGGQEEVEKKKESAGKDHTRGAHSMRSHWGAIGKTEAVGRPDTAKVLEQNCGGDNSTRKRRA